MLGKLLGKLLANGCAIVQPSDDINDYDSSRTSAGPLIILLSSPTCVAILSPAYSRCAVTRRRRMSNCSAASSTAASVAC